MFDLMRDLQLKTMMGESSATVKKKGEENKVLNTGCACLLYIPSQL